MMFRIGSVYVQTVTDENLQRLWECSLTKNEADSHIHLYPADNPMKTMPPEKQSKSNRRSRLDAMLDEPCRNERYGGMTMREMVRKVVLRRDDPIDEREQIDRK